jgi:dihydropteroate synthase
MGVLNLTPDSFSDGGKFNKKKKELNKQLKCLNLEQILLILVESLQDQDLNQIKKIEWNRIKKY